jgi:sugar lactone lactonase YvrE
MRRKILGYGLLLFISLLLAALGVLRWRWGGGTPYPDLSTAPLLDTADLEVVLAYPEPPGNVAVSATGRIFITIHPESRTKGPRVLEVEAEGVLPYPGAGFQERFHTPLGLFIDTTNRLWVLDHGNHGTRRPQLFGFDLETDSLIYHHTFNHAEAPIGSYLNDLQVAAGKEAALITDLSTLRQRPALLVHDLGMQQTRRLLERDSTTRPQPWNIQALTLPGNWASLRLGIDGIALDAEERQVYFAAVCHQSLYRVALTDLLDTGLPARMLRERVEWAGKKPLSDGLSIDRQGRVILTDVEHHGLTRMAPDGRLQTLIQAPGQIRWADGCSYGPDQYLYFTDSALPDLLFRSRKSIRKKGPYFLYRIPMDAPGIPGR